MSGFTLRVYFYGLAALLPEEDGSREVVLVKSDHGQHDGGHAPACGRHYSYLAARASHAEGDHVFGHDYADADYAAVWNPVSGLDISFSGVTSADGPVRESRLTPEIDLTRPSSAPNELADASWMLRLSHMLARNPDYLDHVDSRMRLHGGTLKTLSLSTLRSPAHGTPSLKAPVFRLELNGHSRTQALGDAAVWEREMKGDSLEVRAHSLADGAPVRTMRLYPQLSLGSSRRCLDLFFANPPVTYPATHDCYVEDGDRRSTHFSVYYRLFDTNGLSAAQLAAVPEVADEFPAGEGFPRVAVTPTGVSLPFPKDIDGRVVSRFHPSAKDACVIVQ